MMAQSQDPMRFGTQGIPVIVKTNAFRFRNLPERNYFHYDVTITQLNVKQRDGTTINKELKAGQRYTEIIHEMQVQHASSFPMRASYDGLKNLYVPFVLRGAEFRVVIDGRSFLVQLKQVSAIDVKILKMLISGEGAGANLTAGPQAVAVNLLQVLVSQKPHINHKFSPHAKSFFLDRGKRPLPGGLVALPGFFQSVRPMLGQFIVNVDTTTAAFYPAGPLRDAAMGFFNANSTRDLILRCNNPESLEKLRRFLFKVAVRIEMPGLRRNAKRYIKRLVPRAGYATFEKGRQLITVKDHYAEEYNLILQDPDMFGVQFDNEAIYPAELCVIAEGQRYKKKLDPDQTRQFLTVSVRKPHARISDIERAVMKQGDLEYDNSPYMLDANVKVDTKPLEIPGRELPAVAVGYGTGQEETPRDGAWNAMRKTFINPAVINAWAVVSFDDKPGAIGDVRRFAHNLLDNMKKLGMKFHCADPGAAPMPGQIPTPITEGNQYKVDASLSKVVESMRLPPGRKPNFILVVLPMNAADLRRQVKWWGDVMYGISTQCVRAGKYNRGNDQYCNNVALKINAKADGVSFVPSKLMRKALDKTMVVGCDVSHPAPGVRDRPSIASVVSSYHFSQSQYNASIDCQDPRREIIENFAPMMKNAVDVYAAANTVKIKSETDPTKVVQTIRQYPETILVYRDGVSEGEYEQVIEQEIKPLKAMLWEEFKRDIKVVFVVVGKRHHVRFFPKDQSQSDRSGNCRAGLVIDQGVVHSRRTDFYLQSHGGLIGTSRSSHYVVLHNEMSWNADALQEISYVLCHVYAAATRSVSIPAPVYYADRACTRAAFQFRQDGTVPDYESSADPDGAFDLKVWREALMQSKIAHRMYFM